MTPEDLEIEIAEAEAAAAKKKAPVAQSAPIAPPEPVPGDDPGRKIGEPTARERRWGQIVSFMSGSPLFGTVSNAAGVMSRSPELQPLASAVSPLAGVVAGASAMSGNYAGKNNLLADANKASEQYSPKIPKSVPLVGGAPVLPLVGGMVATAPAGAANIGRGVLTRAGAGMLPARAAMAGRVGLQGGVGALTAADRGGDAGDIALGGGAGLVGGAVGEGASAGVASGLQSLASRMGLRAMGARAGITESLGKHGYETVADGRRLANEALEAGVIRAGRTAEDVAKQAGEHQEFVSGPLIDDAISRANAAAASGAAQPFDFDQAAWRSAENLMSRNRSGPAPLNPQEQAVGHGAMNMVRRISETATPEGMGSFSEANRLKQGLQNSVNYGVNATKESTQMQRGAAAGMRQSIEEQVGRAAGPEVAETLAGANSRWGSMQDVKEIALDEARRQAQRKFPLGQVLMGAVAGGAGSQSPLGAAAVGSLTALGHYLGPRVPSTVAVGAFKAAPAVQKLGSYVAMTAPAAARQSVADPMGPLRQYLGLSREERNEANTQAFEDSP